MTHIRFHNMADLLVGWLLDPAIHKFDFDTEFEDVNERGKLRMKEGIRALMLLPEFAVRNITPEPFYRVHINGNTGHMINVIIEAMRQTGEYKSNVPAV